MLEWNLSKNSAANKDNKSCFQGTPELVIVWRGQNSCDTKNNFIVRPTSFGLQPSSGFAQADNIQIRLWNGSVNKGKIFTCEF